MEQPVQQSAVPAQHVGDPPNEPAHAFLDLAEQLDWNAVEAAVVADPSLVSALPGRRLSALHHAARANDGEARAREPSSPARATGCRRSSS